MGGIYALFPLSLGRGRQLVGVNYYGVKSGLQRECRITATVTFMPGVVLCLPLLYKFHPQTSSMRLGSTGTPFYRWWGLHGDKSWGWEAGPA